MRTSRTLVALATALTASACQTPPPSVESPVQARMFEHFALARDLRVLVVAGDMDQLRLTAEGLATGEETWGMPPGSDPYLERIREAAQRAASAESTGDIAQAVADVARECGDCHVSVECTLGERFQVAEPLTDNPAIRHANRLSWVSRLLWDGLVGPAERMWLTGATALAATDGVPAPRGTHVPGDVLDRTGTQLMDLGGEALTEEDPVRRSEILAEVWTICTDCHAQAGIR